MSVFGCFDVRGRLGMSLEMLGRLALQQRWTMQA